MQDGIFEALDVRKTGDVAVVRLNRPSHLNAVDAVMHNELGRVWSHLESDDDVDCIVITGAGDAFSVGGDLEWTSKIHGSIPEQASLMKNALAIIDNMIAIQKPVVAAVNGHAIGLGATLALLADITVIGESAKIGDTHVKAGVVAGDGGVLIWPLLVGLKRAKELLLTGALLEADQARELGLVNRVVPDDKVMTESMELARELANGAPWAIRWTKQCLQQWLRIARALTMPSSAALEMLTFNTEDQLEGMQALVERRPPRFDGV